MTIHRPTGTEHIGTGSWLAHCLCGHSVSRGNQQDASVALYMHVIAASRPDCPTPHKNRYTSQLAASNAISQFLNSPGAGARPVQVYQCPSGQHWHTTKKPAPRRTS